MLDEQRDKIGRITTGGVISEFPLPRDGRNPTGIATGPDGALWFTETDGNRIGRITTAGAITEYPLPAAGSFPWDITVGPDGALWFTEFGLARRGGNKIGRITTVGGFRECPIPTANSAPYGIAPGPDGALWFTEYEGNLIGRLSARGCLVRGKTVGVEPVRGKLLLSLAPAGARMASAIPAAKGPRFEVERRARQIPVGSLVDVRRGSVILSSGRTANGNEINSGVFGGGRFQVLQSRKRRLAGLTTLRLQGGDYAKCATRARSSGAVLPVQSARLRQRTIRRIRGRALAASAPAAATAPPQCAGRPSASPTGATGRSRRSGAAPSRCATSDSTRRSSSGRATATWPGRRPAPDGQPQGRVGSTRVRPACPCPGAAISCPNDRDKGR